LSFCSPNGGNNNNPTKKQGVCHTVALPSKLKSILRQKKKNYENSNKISPCKNIINLQNNPLKETKKILQDIIIIITLL
jgi:hypothetical protein